MKSLEKMKQKVVLFVMAMFVSIYTFAQEEGAKVDINVSKETSTSTTWYAEPWVWVIGAAVFILLFAAIIRSSGSGRRSDA